MLSQRTRAVCFQLVPDFLRRLIGNHNDVYMIGACIHRQKVPSPMFTMLQACLFNRISIVRFEQHCLALHLLAAPFRQKWSRQLLTT